MQDRAGRERALRSRARVAVGVAVPAGLVLAGCGGGSSVPAAPDADDPACAAAIGRLPQTLLGQPRGEPPATGTAAYGDPRIVVRCGVPPLGPTELPCLGVNEVDWVIDQRDDPLVFTTFGRSPALEVRIPASYPKSADSGALVDLAPAAGALPATSLHCVG